jgi:UDP-N-acetylglucosamine 2-epimerase (non-hydrolysing)
MPEEINRIVTDALCDLLWTPSPDADENLRAEGVPEEKIVRVGNVMLDAYEMMREKISADPITDLLGLTVGEYGVVTLHRPFNVDEEISLGQLVETIRAVSELLPLAFPVHPRTRSRLEAFGLWDTLDRAGDVLLMEPLSYIPFMSLVQNARMVITDSGGIQEETTYLGIPCLTLRPNTERPITITHGTNQLVTAETLLKAAGKHLALGKQEVQPIEFWDGHTADRVVENLRVWMQG